ncbi:hypothetical protein CURT_1075 [Campylobacter ureolyticus]|uniref:Uncharacterized protein n=1 Tax=Campylobacter ureolyticus TaxID=827 RepID=A0AAE7JQ10_9BACT|nr:hypothetical protein CURT_1075 [Campylobacter ureolyticus]
MFWDLNKISDMLIALFFKSSYCKKYNYKGANSKKYIFGCKKNNCTNYSQSYNAKEKIWLNHRQNSIFRAMWVIKKHLLSFLVVEFSPKIFFKLFFSKIFNLIGINRFAIFLTFNKILHLFYFFSSFFISFCKKIEKYYSTRKGKWRKIKHFLSFLSFINYITFKHKKGLVWA